MNLYLQENKFKYFLNDISQKDNRQYRNWCSVFAPFINYKFNTGGRADIWDIIKVANQAKSKGWLYDDKWWYWANAKLIAEYNMRNIIIFNKNDKIFRELFNKGYAITVWISVNKSFLSDSQDNWVLDEPDYAKYKWEDFKHFFNVYKRMSWDDKGDARVIDNYFFDKEFNTYKVDIEEMHEIMYPTCYTFI